MYQYVRDFFQHVRLAYVHAGIASNQVLPDELYEICKTGAFAIMADRRVKEAWLLSEYMVRKKPVPMWQDASGKQKPVTELDDGHLINIVRSHALAIRLQQRGVSFWTLAQQVEAELPTSIANECKRRGINIELVLPYENVPKS